MTRAPANLLWGLLLVLLAVPLAFAVTGVKAEPAPVPLRSTHEDQNLIRNLRWMLARQRASNVRPTSGSPVVGVYADDGAWHVGARSVVESLEAMKVPCRVLDRSRITPAELQGLTCLVIPGGWAPQQSAALGNEGVQAIRTYVSNGGRYLGICAGAYLAAKTTRWQGTDYPYPLCLFDGVAQGPVEGLAPWPKASAARLDVTDQGLRRGLALPTDYRLFYQGGCRFIGGTGVEVLARYADGSAALVSRRVGKGEVVLSGVHFERPAPQDGDDKSPPPALAGQWLKRLLLPTDREPPSRSSDPVGRFPAP